jgi:hypothetical protein
MFSSVDVGRSRISVSTSQGGRCRHFLVLMVGAPGFSGSTSQGAYHRRFLALMVGAPGFYDACYEKDVFSTKFFWSLRC